MSELTSANQPIWDSSWLLRVSWSGRDSHQEHTSEGQPVNNSLAFTTTHSCRQLTPASESPTPELLAS